MNAEDHRHKFTKHFYENTQIKGVLQSLQNRIAFSFSSISIAFNENIIARVIAELL